ncbi:sensor histidine kinase [Paenibacillus azoreducens]|uniref:sensor histidine kinase n=1 Tax=Paenibacillus azoreducens TaxID=116718 RepID=UPI0039F6244E
MNGKIVRRFKPKISLLIAVSMIGYALLAFYIHYMSIKSPFIGIHVRQESGSGFSVDFLEERGKAGDWDIEPGDRILSIKGAPHPKLLDTGNGQLLSKADLVVVRKMNGTRLEFGNAVSSGDIIQTIFSVLVELTLLGIGCYAVLLMPESRIMRLFYILNWTMALSILTQFSYEHSLSEILISFISVWMPYLLLSFYLSFVFRTTYSRFKRFLLLYKGYSALFSAWIAYSIMMELDMDKWAVDLMNFTVIAALFALAYITLAYWKEFERIEKNQLRVLIGGLFLSLLPYMFLYAVPVLIGGDYVIPVQFTLIGLVPFSCTIMYLLTARSMIAAPVDLPRLVIYCFYAGTVFVLFFFASKGGGILSTCLLFIVFVLATWAHLQVLRRFPRRTEKRAEWLERQRRLFSLQVANKKHGKTLSGLNSERRISDLASDSRNLLEAQQSERMRITYFLHDHLLQNLIFLSRDLEELHDTGLAEQERVAVWLKCLYDSQRDIRTMCDDIYPHIIEQGDLKEALQWLIRTMRQKGDIAMELVYELPPGEPKDEWIKTNLFRVVREFVHNVFKHSRASEMSVRLWPERHGICCSVRDNGIGFDIDSVLAPSPAAKKSFGLLSAYSQIRYLGGDADIQSAPGEGTVIKIYLPLGKEEELHA